MRGLHEDAACCSDRRTCVDPVVMYSIFVKLRTPLVLLTPAVSLARFASLGAKDGIDLLTPVGCPQRVTSTRPCEFCEKDARFQKGGVIFANSAKKTHVSHG